MSNPLPITALGPGRWKSVFYICWGALYIYCSPLVGDRTLFLVLLFCRLALVLVGFVSIFESGLSLKLRARLFGLVNVPLAGFFYLYAIAEEQAEDWVVGVLFPLLLIGGALLIFLVDWYRLTQRKETP